MNIKANQLANLIKKDIGLFLSISFGIFLFILFFQPFPLESFDQNNTLIFIAGISLIAFILMVLVRFFYGSFMQNYKQNNFEHVIPSFIGGFILLSLTSISLAFYLRYVGFVSITFYIMFKIILISFVPPVVLRLYDTFSELKKQNALLKKEKEIIQQQAEECQENYVNKIIELTSENDSEKIELRLDDIVFIKSADNYVEIGFKEENKLRKKLLRNTLKNIERVLKPYSNFVRSHRICLVNKHYVEKLNRRLSNYYLTLKGYGEPVPVSRQYLLLFRDLKKD